MDKKQFKQFAEKIVKKYKKILLLDSYKIDINYTVDDANNYGEVELVYPYKNYTIDLSPRLIKKDKKFIEDVIVHELCHILSAPLVSKAHDRFASKNSIVDEMENLTDHIKNIIIKQHYII